MEPGCEREGRRGAKHNSKKPPALCDENIKCEVKRQRIWDAAPSPYRLEAGAIP